MLAKARATTGQVIESTAILPHPGLQFSHAEAGEQLPFYAGAPTCSAGVL